MIRVKYEIMFNPNNEIFIRLKMTFFFFQMQGIGIKKADQGILHTNKDIVK